MARRLGVVNSLNVPSLATLSRYRKLVGWERRAANARAVYERLVEKALALAAFFNIDLAYAYVAEHY